MTVTSSIVCERARPYIMSPQPCWRRMSLPDPGKVVTGLGGCARIRASPRRPERLASLGTVTVKTRAEPVQIWRHDSLP